MPDPKGPPRELDDGRTIIMPTPGGKRRGGAAAGAPPVGSPPGLESAPGMRGPATRSGPAIATEPVSLDAIEGVGDNPLLRASGTILALIPHLRTTPDHQDVIGLRQRMIGILTSFEDTVCAAGIDPETARRAKYALCTLVDESVMTTPWGHQTGWGTESLLVTFFGEVFGGERFYVHLGQALEYPARNLDFLELNYVCLVLGYKGRYGRDPDGPTRLRELTRELYRVIRHERGEPLQELSPRWAGVIDRRPKISQYMAWWVVPVVAVAVCLLSYVGLSYALNEESDPVFAQVSDLKTPPPLPEPAADVPFVLPIPARAPDTPTLPVDPNPPPNPLAEDLCRALKAEITAKDLAIQDQTRTHDLCVVPNPGGAERLAERRQDAESVKIILFNSGLFPSGRAAVGDRFKGIIEKIGAVLKQDRPPGPYIISGHSDNVPIRTARFPSNFHLSKARAEAVAAILSPVLDGTAELQVEGLADKEPIGDNATADGRALNRRVEIDVPNQLGDG